MQNMTQYPIAAWYYLGLNRPPEEKVDTWHDLGLNVVTLAYSLEQKDHVLRALDRAASYDMKLILMDPRTSFHVYYAKGEEQYRAGLLDAIADFGSHPALFGFDIGDEPDAPYAESAFNALRINEELAPHLTAFLNILPWFNGVEERIGSPALAPYLDRITKEGHAKVVGYDCYAHMKTDIDDRDTYFNNLREHALSFRRNGTPFISTVLCAAHFRYRSATLDNLHWQLSTSVAHGATGVMWFHIELDPRDTDYRNAPINRFGERTEVFNWMREANLEFQNRMGAIMTTLSIDKCYHVGNAYGGVPLFEPFESILDISGERDLVISSFHNKEGELYYVICNNTPNDPTYVSMKVKDGVTLEKCVWDSKFAPMPVLRDAVGATMGKEGQSFGFFLPPGRMILLREKKN